MPARAAVYTKRGAFGCAFCAPLPSLAPAIPASARRCLRNYHQPRTRARTQMTQLCDDLRFSHSPVTSCHRDGRMVYNLVFCSISFLHASPTLSPPALRSSTPTSRRALVLDLVPSCQAVASPIGAFSHPSPVRSPARSGSLLPVNRSFRLLLASPASRTATPCARSPASFQSGSVLAVPRVDLSLFVYFSRPPPAALPPRARARLPLPSLEVFSPSPTLSVCRPVALRPVRSCGALWGPSGDSRPPPPPPPCVDRGWGPAAVNDPLCASPRRSCRSFWSVSRH